jgi:hypothetical protein
MDNYSATLPSGTTPFKMWRRDLNEAERFHSQRVDIPERWVVGQYYPIELEGQIGIRWFKIVYLQGPMPPGWQAPDWSNFDRWVADGKAEEAAEAAKKDAAQAAIFAGGPYINGKPVREMM